MSKKTPSSKRNSEPDGIKVEKNTGIFSLLAATIAGAVQKIFLMAKYAAGKEKKRETALPESNDTTTKTIGEAGSKWELGCSATSAGDIAAIYDREEYPNIYTGPANGGVMPLDNSSWPTYTDAAGDIYSEQSFGGLQARGGWQNNPGYHR